VNPTRARLVTKIDRTLPLAGLLECGACSSAMCLHYVAKKNGRKIARYRCTTTFQRGWKACPIKAVNADQIERWTQDQVAKLIADGSLLDAAIAATAADDDRACPLRNERAAARSARRGPHEGRPAR
jgi:Recombinase zinc beta ribbon domain